MKNLDKWKNIKFEYGDDKEFANLSRNFKSFLKQNLNDNYELVNYNKGYFYISGFIKNLENNKYMYFSIPDVRYDNTWYNHILYRTAENEKDFTGGRNKYCPIEDLVDNIQNVIKSEMISHTLVDEELEYDSA